MITQSDDDILFLNACLISGSILFDNNNFNAGFLRKAELPSLQARHRRFESIGTANRHDQLTDTQLGRINQNGVRYFAGVGLDDGQVRPGIVADDATIDLLAVAKADTNMLVATDDVMIGQKEPIGREEDARAAAAASALPATQVHDRGPQHFRHINY